MTSQVGAACVGVCAYVTCVVPGYCIVIAGIPGTGVRGPGVRLLEGERVLGRCGGLQEGERGEEILDGTL